MFVLRRSNNVRETIFFTRCGHLDTACERSSFLPVSFVQRQFLKVSLEAIALNAAVLRLRLLSCLEAFWGVCPDLAEAAALFALLTNAIGRLQLPRSE